MCNADFSAANSTNLAITCSSARQTRLKASPHDQNFHGHHSLFITLICIDSCRVKHTRLMVLSAMNWWMWRGGFCGARSTTVASARVSMKGRFSTSGMLLRYTAASIHVIIRVKLCWLISAGVFISFRLLMMLFLSFFKVVIVLSMQSHPIHSTHRSFFDPIPSHPIQFRIRPFIHPGREKTSKINHESTTPSCPTDGMSKWWQSRSRRPRRRNIGKTDEREHDFWRMNEHCVFVNEAG